MLLDFFKQRGRRFSESQDTCIWYSFWLFPYLQDGMEQSALNSGITNTAISDSQQVRIARSVAAELEQTGADVIVTACPLCKKAIGRGTRREIRDLSEIVAAAVK